MALPTPDTKGTAGVAGANWPVSLGGRNYMLDFSRNAQAVDRSIPLLRNQADTGGEWSEASLNPDDLVRRSAVTWHRGHGQSNRDLPDADPARYHVSGGVNVWSKGKLMLMPDQTLERSITAAYTDTPKTRAITVNDRVLPVEHEHHLHV